VKLTLATLPTIGLAACAVGLSAIDAAARVMTLSRIETNFFIVQVSNLAFLFASLSNML
jgi:hypothetical protein